MAQVYGGGTNQQSGASLYLGNEEKRMNRGQLMFNDSASSGQQFQEPKKPKPLKQLIQRDETGNIIYPIVINSSL